ncbi:hypothetical protein C9I99_12060 [Photobacterium lutimaris]|uniref:Uncharacterized protein n=1 Tax=Photobacterium lutimaris TaxID=388278 RepID=A0A2T3IY61_9GAMM|nr:hypothetical protein C9I99_12060 [Photobacterium lutimaris]TDR74660.1 hypothetical protein DFP78_107248 [Photobacterium lutimaris]
MPKVVGIFNLDQNFIDIFAAHLGKQLFVAFCLRDFKCRTCYLKFGIQAIKLFVSVTFIVNKYILIRITIG